MTKRTVTETIDGTTFTFTVEENVIGNEDIYGVDGFTITLSYDGTTGEPKFFDHSYNSDDVINGIIDGLA